MRALVTGGAGFVGSHLVEILLREHYDVVVLDDLSTGRRANLADAPRAQLVEGTILDAPLVDELVDDADVVFHLAATVGVQHVIDSPLDAMLVNARGTDVVLASCARASRAAVLVSTSEVNGKARELPMREDDDRILGSTRVPRWSYASAKALDEHLALAYAARGLPVSVVRYFNAYGPRLDPSGYGSVVARFIAQAITRKPLTVHGDGRQTRSFAFVTDTAWGTYLAGTTPEAVGTVINLGATREISVLALAHLVRDVVGSDAPIELIPHERAYGPSFEDTLRRVPDIARARDLLGWSPTVGLEDGLERTVQWWERTHGVSRGATGARQSGAPSSSTTPDPLAEGHRVGSSRPTIVVMGLGYVGLPLALAFAEAGFPTIGFDVDCERVAALNAGHSHIEDVSDASVATSVTAGTFVASADPDDIGRGDCVFVCVPTPFDDSKTPDLGSVRHAAEILAGQLRRGMLVVLQSTTFPGTTTEVVQPILERSGLHAGYDFDLAFSPERVDPGNRRWSVKNTPKLVGAVTEHGSQRTAQIFEAIMERPGLVRRVSTPESAEMAKLLENTYRAVNIALVNEMAMLAHEMHIDLWEVIDAAATKPFGFQAFTPGVGPGGHCIPVDPYYLSWKARAFDFQTKFIELAADINLRMVDYVRTRVISALNRRGRSLNGSRVLAVGVSFKAGVGDLRNSRALRLVELLEADGATVCFSDPHVPTAVVNGREMKSVELTEDVVAQSDLVLLLVAHRDLDLGPVLSSGVSIFDVVNATAGLNDPRCERL